MKRDSRDQAQTSRPVYRHRDLERLIEPRSLAVVGASPNPSSFGAIVLENLRGFSGAIYPVNPKYPQLGERACFASLADLPEVPDCVVVAVPRSGVEPIVAQCVQAKVGGAVIFASGYAETRKPERIAQQDALAALAAGSGLRIVGPNCIGLTNYSRALALNFTRAIELPAPGRKAIGLASQSGAMANAVAQASRLGLSVSHILTSGNSVDVDVADYVAYLAEDPACSVVVCIFEGLASPARLLEAAEIARRNDKPLIVYKVATGEKGAAAALSHTGVLAGSLGAYQAAFERMGAVVVSEFEALAETAAFFAKAPRPKGRGTGVIAGSGGFCVMAVDAAHENGVTLHDPDESVRGRLRDLVPEFGIVGNPCDVTGQNTPDTFRKASDAFLQSPDFGAVVVPYTYTFPGEARLQRLLGMAQAAEAHGKIVCLPWSTAWSGGPGAKEAWSHDYMAVFGSVDRCFRALAAWHRRDAQLRAEAQAHPEARRSAPESAARAAALIASQPGSVISEELAKRVLAVYGVPVVAERLVTSADAAVDAARSVGFPVAMKVDSPRIPHKTEAGVVRLGLASEEAVTQAYAELMQTAAQLASGDEIRGVLVQPMVTGGVELVVGVKIDPLFGPLVLVGLGGIFTELLKDVVMELAPVGARRARGMLDRLKAQQLLNGFRGAAGVDRDMLADIIARVSELISDQQELICEGDVNPLICAGSRAVAVDALFLRRQAS